MSEVVDDFPLPAHAVYDWPSWFDGKIRKFMRGVDFETAPRIFAKAAYKWGSEHGMKVRTRVVDDCVWLQAHPRVERAAIGRTRGQRLLRAS